MSLIERAAASQGVAQLCLVRFDSQGGSPLASREVKPGAVLDEPEVPVLAGCCFVRWYRDREYCLPWDFPRDRVEANLTLYALWDLKADLSYTISGGGEVTVTSYDGDERSVTVPAYIEGYPVRGIGDGFYCSSTGAFSQAFTNSASLIELILPDGLTSIGTYSFVYCTHLASLSLPGSLATVGYGAFGFCAGLKALSLPAGMTDVYNNAFYGCTGLKSVLFPRRLGRISSYAFYNCTGLESLSLPEGLSDLGSYAFGDCPCLTEVICEGAVPPALGNRVFHENGPGRIFSVPPGAAEAYREMWPEEYGDVIGEFTSPSGDSSPS